MSAETQYDEIIAPMLRDVAAKCVELGMSIVACVEYEKDESGITTSGVGPGSGVAQRMAEIAVRSRGNIDTFCIESLKRFDCSQSVFLRQFNKVQS